MRQDEICDTLANILTEVCSDVATEPMIPSGDDEKRLDIRTRGFWGGRLEVAFFDVRVCLCNLSRLHPTPPALPPP